MTRFVPITLLLLVGLPLGGIVLNGGDLTRYLEFPPQTRYVEHALFSWPVFGVLALLIAVVLLPFTLRVACSSRPPRPALSLAPDSCLLPPVVCHFPLWGWAGLALGIVAWLLAWTRFPWFAPLQPFTFSPLWFAYIAVINALTFRRTGHCMLTDRPRYLFRLFVLSAAFWWFFEYLNRFVQNWYYVGIGTLTPWEYFIFATLPFSTVLPAVLGTYEFLASFPRLSAGLGDFLAIRPPYPKVLAGVTLAAACAGLAGIGVCPDLLFPLLWLAPLMVITSLQALAGRSTLLTDVARGDWRRLWLLAMSALVCGFFWEMWNYQSLAKWIYTVPYVGRFKLFEMPILGYAGYLPFGLECAAVAGFLTVSRGGDKQRPDLFWNLGPRSGQSSTLQNTRNCASSSLGGTTSVSSVSGWLRWWLARTAVTTGLFLIGVSFIPYRWCARDADAWFRGDSAVQDTLARGVEAWVEKGLSRDNFHTGSAQFDGEWLFGSYLMAGFGFAQQALEHSGCRARNLRIVETCIERLLTPDVRAFDREMWRSDPIESLANPAAHHAAFLGYFNLLLGLHRQLEPTSRFAELNDRITAALVHRVEASSIGLLQSYPSETYPVDNCAVMASIAVHSRVTGSDRRDFLNRCYRLLREKCIDRRTGLLIQAVYWQTGEPIDDPRGSGTALGLYFLSFADRTLSAELYRAVRRELFDTVFGFGGVKEYPAHLTGTEGDIDSGPVVFGYGLSPTGFLIGGARIHGDRDAFKRLFATAYACGAPYEHKGKLNFVTGASLGDAILFAMLTAGGPNP